MIKDNQQQLNRLRVVADIIAIVAAYFLTFLFFFYIFPSESIFGGSFSYQVPKLSYELAILYILPIHLIFYVICHLYRPMRVTGRRLEAFNVFKANFFSILVPVLFFWLFIKDYSTHFSRMFLFEFGIVNTLGIVLERNLVRMVVVTFRKKGVNQKHILVVGYSRSCEAFLKRVLVYKQWGYDIYGILDDTYPVGTTYRDFPVIGKIDRLPEILAENFIDEVFVTLRLKEYEKLEKVVRECEKSGVQTKFVPDYNNLMSNRPYTEDLQGLPVVYVRQVPLNDMLNAFVKRTVDIIGSMILILLFSPVMLVTALLVKLSSPGPVIFKQERVGLHNKPFMMYKFRSMGVQKEADEKKGWTKKNDPRVTPVGKVIRKTSIDELPQFFNVLLGQMSLVGPRPERPQFVEKFKEEIPRYMVKHQVRPGITGWAQVNGLRGDTSIKDRIDHDIYYIENWSLGFDIRILFLTVFKGFVNKNAY